MTLNTFSWVHWTVVYHPCEMSKSYAYCLLGVLFFVFFFPPYLLKVLSFLLGIALAPVVSGSYMYRSIDEIELIPSR